MKRKLIAVFAAAAMLLTLAPAASAGSVAGGAGGNCVNDGPKNFLAGKNQYDYNNVAGVQATIDPANTGSDDLCDDPGVFWNNGVFHSIIIGQPNCSGNICGQITLGVANCDNPAVQGLNCQKNVWHYAAQFTDCWGMDSAVDLGTANNPWQQHTYKLMFGYGQGTWWAYIDGVLKPQASMGVTSPNWSCLNLDTGHNAASAWASERWDAGDAWSYNGVNPWDTADFGSMLSYIGGGNWTIPPTVGCNFNIAPQYHSQSCDGNGSRSFMRTWTVY